MNGNGGKSLKQQNESLEQLRVLLKSKPKLNACLDEVYLSRFLRLHDYDAKQAAIHVKNYYRVKRDYPDVFKNVPEAVVLEIFDKKICGITDNVDKDGYLIMFWDTEKWDPAKFNLDQLHAAWWLMLDWASEMQDTQLKGIKAIGNISGFTMTHLKMHRPRHFPLGTKLLESYAPVNLTKVICLNVNSVFDTLYSWFKPLLSQHVIRKLILYRPGADLTSTSDCGIIPQEFGGKAATFDNRAFVEKFKAAKPTLDYYRKFGYVTGNAKTMKLKGKEDHLKKLSNDLENFKVK